MKGLQYVAVRTFC